MIASLNTEQLKYALEITPASHNILLVGKHGIGKSQILTEHFESQGIPVVTLFLGQMSDPGDLIGLPRINPATGKTEFIPPYWFPTEGQPVVLFLDELNRARPEMLQSVMDLVLNRQLAGRRLPEGSRIISAVNDGDEYHVDELDPALMSRFNIYEFRPTAKEWCQWARSRGLDSRTVSFIEQNPSMLDGNFNVNDESFVRFPDRRAWHRVADILGGIARPTAVTFKVIAGIVGALAASRLNEFLTHHTLDASQLLLDFDNHTDTLQALTITEASRLNESIYGLIDSGKYPSARVNTMVENLIRYIEWLKERHRDETLAHFISLFSSGSYPAANQFMITKSPNLYREFTSFILTMKK